jgi:hypothetical protein
MNWFNIVPNCGQQHQLQLQYKGLKDLCNDIAAAIVTASTTFVCILPQYQSSQ